MATANATICVATSVEDPAASVALAGNAGNAATAATTGPGPAGQKRAADKHSDERATKRRSPRACLSCRSRKVRCDVVNRGSPCTNCRLDDVACVLRESSRGRKPKSLTTSGTTAAATPAIAPRPHAAVHCPPAGPSPPPHVVDDDDAFLVSLTFDGQLSGSLSGEGVDDSQDDESRDGLDDGHVIQGQEMHEPLLDPYSNTPGVVDLASPEKSQKSQTSRRSQQSHHSNRSQVTDGSQPQPNCFNHALLGNGRSMSRVYDAVPFPLPPYIKRLSSHITQRDLEYLAEKDALTIPDDEFRDELLRTYVKIVYCFVPALDFSDFLDPIINGGDISHPVSLLLFQAVMFASVVFVDSSLLKSRGFASRKVARKVFFNRVRLLYGLDCEPDRMALIQSLLLMTYWYDSPDDEKDTWYWMGITLSLAQVMGLHRDPEMLDISESAKRLRRRIWWSCFIRDRLLALGIRRPARIRSEDFNVPMLELADYDLGQPVQERIVFVRESGFTSVEEDGRRQMCQICIDLAKLCVCVGNILQSQYSVVGTNAESHKNMAVLPKQSKTQMADLVKCDSELDDWHRNQKATSKYSPRSPSSVSSGQRKDDWAEDITWLHQALLHMIYLTTLGALHRPRALMSAPSWLNASDANIARKSSLSKVKEAAIAMTRLAFDLQSENHLRYLWTSSVPAFLSATLIHLLDIHDPDEQVRNMCLGRFYQCFHALCELQDMYTSADYALRFLEKVLNKAGTNIPMLQMLKLCSSTSTMVKSHISSSGSNHRRLSSCVDARDTSAARESYNPNAMASVDYSVLAAGPHTVSHLHQFSIPGQIPPLLLPPPPPQRGPSQTHTGQMAPAYPHSYSDFIQPLGPEINVPEQNTTEDRDLLLNSSPQGNPRPGPDPSSTTGAHLGFGPLSDLSTGTQTLIDTPPSHIDVWGEFDGLLFALPNFDATDPCAMMPL